MWHDLCINKNRKQPSRLLPPNYLYPARNGRFFYGSRNPGTEWVSKGRLRFESKPGQADRVTQCKYTGSENADTCNRCSDSSTLRVTRAAEKFYCEINDWLARIKKTEEFDILYAKYYKNKYRSRRLAKAKEKLEKGQLSAYDELIKQQAERLGWDWRLLTAVVYQESQFDPEAESWAGAQGLLQLMPATAKELGVTKPLDIEQNIDGGARYLRKMLDRFGGDVKLALAAYNAGPGTVRKYAGNVPYRETIQYVERVLRFSEQTT